MDKEFSWWQIGTLFSFVLDGFTALSFSLVYFPFHTTDIHAIPCGYSQLILVSSSIYQLPLLLLGQILGEELWNKRF